ncbi:MAG: metallophosphoesterase [Trueperaceae bacterium]|nr:metallophosphoesterase [Trueperaceae bacterium]
MILPDTQALVGPGDGRFEGMTAWIADAARAGDVAFVTHVGDVVRDAGDAAQWARADAALARLEGVVPYAGTLGNHDVTPLNRLDGDARAWRARFGPGSAARGDGPPGASGLLATSPDGRASVRWFAAGGRTLLHLSVPFEGGDARDDEGPLAWAERVLWHYAGVPTVITTHAYLWDGAVTADDASGVAYLPPSERVGEVVDRDGDSPRVGVGGATLFRRLVAPFDAVFLVIGGHAHAAPVDVSGEAQRLVRNDAGLEVLEVLANFQARTGPDADAVRRVRVVPGGAGGTRDRVEVVTWRPQEDRAGEGPHARFAWGLAWDLRFARP